MDPRADVLLWDEVSDAESQDVEHVVWSPDRTNRNEEEKLKGTEWDDYSANWKTEAILVFNTHSWGTFSRRSDNNFWAYLGDLGH